MAASVDLSDEQQEKIYDLFALYSESLKPLLASVEAQSQELPSSILNEIRSFTDHLSRCYWQESTDDSIDKDLDRAHGHMKRAMLDCLKHSLLEFREVLEKFERETKRIDLTKIGDGEFYLQLVQLRRESIEKTRRAKRMETRESDSEVFNAFQHALEISDKLDQLIADNFTGVRWARIHFTKSIVLKSILFIATAAVSGIVAQAFGLLSSPFLAPIVSYFQK